MKGVIWPASQFVLGVELWKNCDNLGTSFPDRSGKGMDNFFISLKMRGSHGLLGWFAWIVVN